MANSTLVKLFKKIIQLIIPYRARKRFYYYTRFDGPRHEKHIKALVSDVKQRSPIRVLFIVANISMWRGQGLYDLLKKDSRFNPRIIISPFGYYTKDRAEKVIRSIKKYFASKGLDVPSTSDDNFDLDEWFNAFNPDILFICQPYQGIHSNILDIEFNYNRLMAYIPYGTPTMKSNFVYNTEFHNKAWRIYHATQFHLKTAKQIMPNNAINVRIVGESDYDKFLLSDNDPWKIINDGKKRKRIIWAPHFSIPNSGSFLNRASFLWLYDAMFDIAIKYRDLIQLAFKPHPNLYHTLVGLDGWGKERTDNYYRQWASMTNTQLEEGEFIDLFKTSDAMVHDCGSFTGVYLMTHKPVLFLTKNIEEIRRDADDYGLKCLDLHYIGNCVDDLEKFILDTVIQGNDELYNQRDCFFKNAILPPHGNTSSQNIYNDILKSLDIEAL